MRTLQPQRARIHRRAPRRRRRRSARCAPAPRPRRSITRALARLLHAAFAFLFSAPLIEQQWTWMLPNPLK